MKVRVRLWVKIVLFIIALLILLFIYCRFINTSGFNVHEYSIKANVPDSFNGLKIIHISDINYKHTTSKKDLERIIKRINLIRPDIVVFTGDLLNKNIEYSESDINDLIKVLSKINTSIGAYAVSGEEDIAFDNWEDILNKSNFTILDNNYELIYNKANDPILISGMNYNGDNIDSTMEYLNNNDIYSILLVHKPDYIEDIDYSKFNLILAGHSLNGYINIPMIKNIFLDEGAKKYYDSYYKLDKTNLYISNGIGTKDIKFRFLNKPSINFYRLKKS